jgi:hypothetical protein
MGQAMANSAKHKLIGLLSEKLRADEITVGEVVVLGLVKGTVWDTGRSSRAPLPASFGRSTPGANPK